MRPRARYGAAGAGGALRFGAAALGARDARGFGLFVTPIHSPLTGSQAAGEPSGSFGARPRGFGMAPCGAFLAFLAPCGFGAAGRFLEGGL